MGSDQVSRMWAAQGLKNAQFATLLRKRYNDLLIASISEGGLDKVTSATKNGVSMGKQVGLSVPETMEAMSKAISYIDLGIVPYTKRTLGRF
jgi:hypothetical protein